MHIFVCENVNIIVAPFNEKKKKDVIFNWIKNQEKSLQK